MKLAAEVGVAKGARIRVRHRLVDTNTGVGHRALATGTLTAWDVSRS
jgi:hypothetical protein